MLSIQKIHETIRNNPKEVSVKHLFDDLHATNYELIPTQSSFHCFGDDFDELRVIYFNLLDQIIQGCAHATKRANFGIYDGFTHACAKTLTDLTDLEYTLANRIVETRWKWGKCTDNYAVINFQRPNKLAYIGFSTFLDAMLFSQHMLVPNTHLKGLVFEQKQHDDDDLSELYDDPHIFASPNNPKIQKRTTTASFVKELMAGVDSSAKQTTLVVNYTWDDGEGNGGTCYNDVKPATRESIIRSLMYDDEPDIWVHGDALDYPTSNDYKLSHNLYKTICSESSKSIGGVKSGNQRKGKILDKYAKQQQEKYERKEGLVLPYNPPKRGKGKWNKRNRSNETDHKQFYVNQDLAVGVEVSDYYKPDTRDYYKPDTRYTRVRRLFQHRIDNNEFDWKHDFPIFDIEDYDCGYVSDY